MLDERLQEAAEGVRSALAHLTPPPMSEPSPAQASDEYRPGGSRRWLRPAFAAVTAFALVLISVSVTALILRGDDVGVADTEPTGILGTVSTSAPTNSPDLSSVAPDATAPSGPDLRVAAPVIEAAAITAAGWASIASPVGTPAVEDVTDEQGWSKQVLAAQGQQISDWFGFSVAVDGDRIVVGAPATEVDDYVGSAYVFDLADDGTWNETRLTPSDEKIHGQFGMSVAVDGDRVAIGAPFDADFQGSVYVFDRSVDGTWVETKLTASDGTAGDVFGWSVAVDGNRVISGASGDDEGAGSVYVFDSDLDGSWRVSKVAPTDGVAGDGFGSSVAAQNGRLVVGSESSYSDATVYLYESDRGGGWIETKLADHGFGVALDGDRVVVSDRSAVRVFSPGGPGSWVETQVLISGRSADDPGLVMMWPEQPVAASGGRIAFAAFPPETEVDLEAASRGMVDPEELAGSVYVFEPTAGSGWTQVDLDAETRSNLIGYVFRVAADGDRIVVGATQELGRGAVYVYDSGQG